MSKASPKKGQYIYIYVYEEKIDNNVIQLEGEIY